jgi:hypothetical protein
MVKCFLLQDNILTSLFVATKSFVYRNFFLMQKQAKHELLDVQGRCDVLIVKECLQKSNITI